MSTNQLLEQVYYGREVQNLEYKASMSWEDAKYKVAKTALAMANLRDGGVIIFGVPQHGDEFIPEGMEPEHAVTFNQDDVSSHVNKYADPYVETSVNTVTDNEGNLYVVIQVEEFAELPVVCKKDYPPEKIHKGRIYTRTRNKPESAPIPSQTEMRELIELAVDKGVRKFLRRAEETGIWTPEWESMEEKSARQFAQQLSDLNL